MTIKDRIKYQQYEYVDFNNNSLLNIDYNLMIRSDSEQIFCYNQINKQEYCFFKKVNILDTIAVSIFTYSGPDGEKNGAEYHIAYPGLIHIKDYECYKNEYIGYDEDGQIIQKSIYYATPAIGIVRMEIYSIFYNTWGYPIGLMKTVQRDLLSKT